MARDDAGEATRIVTDLATTLLEAGAGPHAEAIARHVLRHTAGGIRLLGVGPDPTDAVCFDPVHRCIYRLPVSPLGVHPTEIAVAGRSVADLHPWIDAHRDELVWVHPRYRGTAAPSRLTWPYRLETCPITPNI